MKFSWFTVLIIKIAQVLFLAPASSFAQTVGQQAGKINIVIEPVYNGQPLSFDGSKYVTEHGDTFTVDLFRFYITDLKLVSAKGSSAPALVKDSWLLDSEDTAGWHMTGNMESGELIAGISFTIGVDSLHNVSGANEGDLDPVKGMYWAWNSGYINAKLEGKSAVCKTLHHAFEFHIGGYMPPYSTARKVSLRLRKAVQATTGNDRVNVIRIRADFAAWFTGNLNLAQTNSVVIPGKEAAAMADKYAQMFSVAE